MQRSPFALAALASVAIPGLDPYDARPWPGPDEGLDSALVVDSKGRRWIARAPIDAASGAALDREIAFVSALAGQVTSGHLPFRLPVPAGVATLTDGGRAVVHEYIPGEPIDLEYLRPGPGLAASVGRALAALHELPVKYVETLGLPSYGADEYRRRRQSEVDAAAKTGHIPSPLLARWEAMLEDVSWWRFRPTVVHGELVAERLLVERDRVTAILGWTTPQVADPADDLAWVLTAASPEIAESVLEAYQLARTELRDPHLADRAHLAGELAVVRWLMYGVTTKDDEIVEDAEMMLADLAAEIRADEAAAV